MTSDEYLLAQRGNAFQESLYTHTHTHARAWLHTHTLTHSHTYTLTHSRTWFAPSVSLESISGVNCAHMNARVFPRYFHDNWRILLPSLLSSSSSSSALLYFPPPPRCRDKFDVFHLLSFLFFSFVSRWAILRAFLSSPFYFDWLIDLISFLFCFLSYLFCLVCFVLLNCCARAEIKSDGFKSFSGLMAASKEKKKKSLARKCYHGTSIFFLFSFLPACLADLRSFRSNGDRLGPDITGHHRRLPPPPPPPPQWLAIN